ncbi:hypothetical protein Tco_0571176, partial [Tanacetum coccineum]
IWHLYYLGIRDTHSLVNLVHVLDFAGLTKGMRQTLAGRLRMVYTGDVGQELFTSHVWRRLFEIRAPLVHLHSDEEMAEDGFQAYWMGSERVIPDKGDLRDYWIEISFDRDFLGGRAPEKVTGVDIFFLRNIDRGTANVSYLLTHYLFRHVEGRKSGARLSGGYFIGRLRRNADIKDNDSNGIKSTGYSELDDEKPTNRIPTPKRELLGSLRWMEANVASFEVESEEWRRLLPHQRCVAIDVTADGREEDFFPRNGK